jgi:hypothetical protein
MFIPWCFKTLQQCGLPWMMAGTKTTPNNTNIFNEGMV